LRLRELAPDCCAITAYGALIPDEVLAIPAHGWVNLHFSLLPAWRGAAPVQRAIMAGDDITGATTFRLVRELDAGPVYGMVTEPVRDDDTAGTLLGRLAGAGAGLLVATMDGIESGALEAREQPADGISLAPKVTPEQARVGWDHPALAIGRQIRGCTPQPGAWTELAGTRLKLGRWPAWTPGTAPLAPGELADRAVPVLVGTGSAPVELGECSRTGSGRWRPRPGPAGCGWPSPPGWRDPATAPRRARAVPGTPRRGPRPATRPGWPPTRCSAGSPTGTPTPTCCCPRC
jgi:methionyl-tRNA formyltransferase